MAYTEVTSTSWFSRLGESLKSVLVGLLLFLGSFPLLFWNEGRAVQTAKSLDEGSGAVVTASSEQVNAANDSKLVHITGRATTDETLTDAEFGVSAKAIKLIRHAEMYQWKEDKRSESHNKLGGGQETVTTFTYEKDWDSNLINSSDFKERGHSNPARMPFESKTITARKVTLGAYTLADDQVRKISNADSLAINDGAAEALASRLKAKVDRGTVYIGESALSPQVGDTRIRFEAVNPRTVSIIAQQVGSSFQPYQTKAGDALLLVTDGTANAAAMFKNAQDENATLTWILRAVGYLLMFFGLLMVFKPISVMGDVVPLVGTLLGAGLGLFSFVLSAALATLTIALAWVVYRPLLGVPLLLASGGAVYWLSTHGKRRQAAKNSGLPAMSR